MFVPHFPLASGQLTSYDELTGPAERLGATPAQVALAWLLRRSSDRDRESADGDEGTVTLVDSLGTVHVAWDRGGEYGLIPGHDF